MATPATRIASWIWRSDAARSGTGPSLSVARSEEHTSELQSPCNLVCRLLLEKKYSQNAILSYQQNESTARVASIMENTNICKQQQISEIMRKMHTQPQTAGQNITTAQFKNTT